MQELEIDFKNTHKYIQYYEKITRRIHSKKVLDYEKSTVQHKVNSTSDINKSDCNQHREKQMNNNEIHK